MRGHTKRLSQNYLTWKGGKVEQSPFRYIDFQKLFQRSFCLSGLCFVLCSLRFSLFCRLLGFRETSTTKAMSTMAILDSQRSPAVGISCISRAHRDTHSWRLSLCQCKHVSLYKATTINSSMLHIRENVNYVGQGLMFLWRTNLEAVLHISRG